MVHPDYKRVGIGKKLMQYCLKRFSAGAHESVAD
ncbi:MAG: GNAT family N-acetyltransferase [Deferribacteres bacterium]|nr:GNAT family N-acetyltransferase [Deferribacteres bacterium]